VIIKPRNQMQKTWFEDTKVGIWSHWSKKDINTTTKRTNNDLQNSTQKTKDRATRTKLYLCENMGLPPSEFWLGPCCSSFYFMWCVFVLFCLYSFCVMWPMLSISLDCTFMIATKHRKRTCVLWKYYLKIEFLCVWYVFMIRYN
jgi:hypothetical protein